MLQTELLCLCRSKADGGRCTLALQLLFSECVSSKPAVVVHSNQAVLAVGNLPYSWYLGIFGQCVLSGLCLLVHAIQQGGGQGDSESSNESVNHQCSKNATGPNTFLFISVQLSLKLFFSLHSYWLAPQLAAS